MKIKPDNLSLWPHQIQAIETISKYVDAFENGETPGSALIQMPTGSGKTGVIAATARCISELGCVLIICPRIALRNQLFKDVSGRFFSRVADPGVVIPKTVLNIDRSEPDLDVGDFQQHVFVCTIQKLHSMKNRNSIFYQRLSKQISLLLIDEGHYEPAPSWSQSIRDLNCPKVLFTATPYRNDLKIFNVDLNHTYYFTFHDAVSQAYLRAVSFVTMHPTKDPNIFVDDILNFYSETFPDNGAESPRVIIRCDKSEHIRQIARALRELGESCVAIHEQFAKNEDRPWEFRAVPDPNQEDVKFWIHQFKLLEGIDDHRFRLLALFDPLKNARALVQQVGRTLRNPQRNLGEMSYVLDHTPRGSQEELWNGYVRYDGDIQRMGHEALNLSIGAGLIPRFLETQPPAAYIDGKFRFPFSLEEFDPSIDLQLPMRINLLEIGDGFELEKLVEYLEGQYLKNDREFLTIWISEDIVIILYISYNNSPYLALSCLMEYSLGVSFMRNMGGHLAFFDSSGYVPLHSDELEIGGGLHPSLLRKLFRRGKSSKLTHMSLKNSNLGLSNIRLRSFSAPSVEETSPGFDDYAQICTTVEGYSEDKATGTAQDVIRRYVGFDRGRISQNQGYISIAEYLQWLDNISLIVNGRAWNNKIFSRYAQHKDQPSNPNPVNILIDIFEVRNDYFAVGSPEIPRDSLLEIPDKCHDVINDHFSIIANGVEHRVSIQYHEEKKRYILSSPELDESYYRLSPDDDRGLINYLNSTQSFRVIPGSKNTVYTLGIFYSPLLRVGNDFDEDTSELVKILYPYDCLAEIVSEKGDDCQDDGEGWENNSIFDLIDRCGLGYGMEEEFGVPDIVVCDDMGTEIADFIVADIERNRVAFIHAKARQSPSYYSASELQDVTAQSVKNLTYVAYFSNDPPSKLNSWAGPWRAGSVNGFVRNRIRKGDGNPDEIWGSIRSVASNPNADREVWLLLGKTLSKSRLIEELKKPKVSPEALQTVYLLGSTLSSVASIGAKLRVFCSP